MSQESRGVPERAAQLTKDGIQATRDVTRWLGQQARSGWRRARSGWRVDVEGLDLLPAGAAIVAVNYLSGQDPMRLASSLGRKVHIYQGEQRRGLRRAASPMDAESAALTALAAGDLVGLFPEGAVSPDGHLHRGTAELARLALRAQVPIVPAAFVNVADELGPNLLLRLGEPVDSTRQAGLPQLSPSLDMIVMQGLTDEVMMSIAQLGGQHYIDRIDADDAASAISMGELQDEAESHFERLQEELAELERRALAEERAEEDELLAAVEAARAQAERTAHRERR